MNHEDDAGEDTLAPIDLHTWRVPPPPPLDRGSLLSRALSPAASPKRSRGMWIFAALAVANVVLAALLVIIISQRTTPTAVTARPAGGGTGDAQTAQLLHHLEQEQRELVAKLAEVEQLRAAVEQLAQKVHDCDQTVKHDRPPAPTPRPAMLPADAGGCDEVSCVLTDYEGACCEKFRGPQPPPRPTTPANSPPDTLDRYMIAGGIAGVRTAVAACGQHAPARGIVKVHVRVDAAGRVTNVEVAQTPEAALGACVRSAIQHATFDATVRGGSFSYPFVF